MVASRIERVGLASVLLLLAGCGGGGGGVVTGKGGQDGGGGVGGAGAGGGVGGAGAGAGGGTAGARDAETPCDPTLCTTPPAAACEQNSVTLDYSVASYDGAPTCTNASGCSYPKLDTPCDHGCYLAQCTAALASITNVQGTATVGGVTMQVSVSGGGAPANSAVTVTARTSPRGAAASLDLNYGTCTANTLCVLADILFMSPDPNTPSGQTDYEQWTATIAAQTAGTKVAFQLQATGAGDLSSMISQASLGVPWSYTSN